VAAVDGAHEGRHDLGISFIFASSADQQAAQDDLASASSLRLVSSLRLASFSQASRPYRRVLACVALRRAFSI